MLFKILLPLIFFLKIIRSQPEAIPYTYIENICKKCTCESDNDGNNPFSYFSLSCEDKQLKHIISRWPEEFGKNQQGKEIVVSFSNNEIPLLQQLPATDAELTFICIHCKISNIQAAIFMDCPNIFRLDLSFNELNEDSLTPDIFRGPYNEHSYEILTMKQLNLSHNQIKSLDSRIFEHIPKLTSLDLSSNQIESINEETLNAINSLQNLQYINLADNNLKFLPGDIFTTFHQLKYLYLQNNKLEFLPNFSEKLAKTLELLNLSGNLFSKFNISSFEGYKSLKFLNISGIDSLAEIEVGTFSSLKNLEMLYSNNNFKLKSFHLPMELNNLKTLDISNCKLDTLIMDVDLIQSESAQPFHSIQSFEISGNPWNCNCVLLKILENFEHALKNTVYFEKIPRCSSPFKYAGERVTKLNGTEICMEEKSSKIQKLPINKDSPTYFRPKSIAIMMVFIGMVVASAIMLGFAAVRCQRKLRNRDIFDLYTVPIRYTTVRNT